MEGVVSVFPSEGKSSLHTTRSWDFMETLEGFNGHDKDFIAQNASYGADIIIGMLYSGIWPESKSFSDEGMGPVCKRWKGVCEEGEAFNSSNCNRKIIGARYYLKGYESYYGELNVSYAYRSPRDHDGHGTHTSSIAAGRPVSASFLGSFAGGTAHGGASLARLAIYKVCWPIPGPNPNLQNTCFDADMLAAIDDAVADGVDILSISIGATGKPPRYAADPIALGTLHALKRGVVAICSAGNSGPEAATVVNLAPWVITVAASSIDREFDAPVVLGNGAVIMGQSISQYNEKMRKAYPLVYAGYIFSPPSLMNINRQCLPNSLAREKVEGKVVLCLTGTGYWVAKGAEVKRAGGAAMIIGNGEAKDNSFPLVAYVLPASAVSRRQALQIRKYISSDRNPTVVLGRSRTVVGVTGAPALAPFSSRGPNSVEPNILKPDITAPGLLILAAWSEVSSPTKFDDDHRIVKYNLYSGTSMACPHASATAALLKSVHPQWTSAAIRSAIITTATVNNVHGEPMVDEAGGMAGPMAVGSGHLRPNHAVNPGLIYDATYADYLLFMCASTNKEIDPSFPCPKRPSSSSDLNHPSVAVTVPSNGSSTIAINRVVTNVGQKPARYEVSIVEPLGFSVKVQPKILQFKMQGEKKKFQITISAKSTVAGIRKVPFVSGSFTWYDGIHYVRSPIIVNVA
ncbi:subtilisin-like protease SBT5.6 [Dendrobium catenatum]|uniref:subtilisin-like protease SBT5.6 n=1 Tax=Dendrobium catenatum TaxID=906689 RepID=UPI0009F6A18F|nr:subtilisin-like protease SBT5.6 [Dendrobium catenatum]